MNEMMPITERQAEGLAALVAFSAILCVYSLLAPPVSFLPSVVSDTEMGTGLAAIALTVEGREKGVFFLPEGARVADLLTAAQINPQQFDAKIKDRIVHSGENVDINGISRITIGKMKAAQALALDIPVDINGLNYEDLLLIPGIGEKTAARIVELREKKGALKKIEELMEIEGIKEKRLAALKKYLFVENTRRD